MDEPLPARNSDTPHAHGAPEALAIVGATASGKTDLSIALAQTLDGEIISMDSRQVYRTMDIGTAKPSAQQRAAVPHFGIDLIGPEERYNAGRFAQESRRWMDAIQAHGHVPILVGGTGFFLRALTHPMFAEPELPADRRAALLSWLDRKPDDELLHWLTELDPETAGRLVRGGGRQRILRALEVVLLSGAPLSWWHRHAPSSTTPVRTLAFLLELPREELYRRINQRVVDMVQQGWVEEVRGLAEQGYDEGAPGMNAVGYREMLDHIRGRSDLAAAIDATQRATRRYARRQQTWFRHQLPAGTITLDARLPVAELVSTIAQRWRGEVNPAHRN